MSAPGSDLSARAAIVTADAIAAVRGPARVAALRLDDPDLDLRADIGCDDLDVMMIVMRLEEIFHFAARDLEVIGLATVGDVQRLAAAKIAGGDFETGDAVAPEKAPPARAAGPSAPGSAARMGEEEARP